MRCERERERGTALCLDRRRNGAHTNTCVSTAGRAGERARGKTNNGDGEAIAVGHKGNRERTSERARRLIVHCGRASAATTARPLLLLSLWRVHSLSSVARPPIKAGKRGREEGGRPARRASNSTCSSRQLTELNGGKGGEAACTHEVAAAADVQERRGTTPRPTERHFEAVRAGGGDGDGDGDGEGEGEGGSRRNRRPRSESPMMKGE